MYHIITKQIGGIIKHEIYIHPEIETIEELGQAIITATENAIKNYIPISPNEKLCSSLIDLRKEPQQLRVYNQKGEITFEADLPSEEQD